MEDKYKAQKKYAKDNIKNISCSFKKEFVDEFNEACKTLGVKKAALIRELMEQTIEKAQKKKGA